MAFFALILEGRDCLDVILLLIVEVCLAAGVVKRALC